MRDVPEEILNEFVETCHRAARHGLMRCSSGNMSVRLDETRMLATASRSWMENVSAEEVSVCRIADGALIEGAKPTVEIGFHAGILRTRADVNVVLHFQTPCATALACRESDDINYSVIPEIPFYIGAIGHVPYISPGSKQLADAVTEAMQEHDLVVMQNHGLVTVAADYAHVIQNAVFFEFACELITINKDEMRALTVDEVRRLKG